MSAKYTSTWRWLFKNENIYSSTFFILQNTYRGMRDRMEQITDYVQTPQRPDVILFSY